MNSKELAEEVGKVVAEAQSRITGIGAAQYADEDSQKFERITIPELIGMMEEELLDEINYAVMNLVRLRQLKEVLSRIIQTNKDQSYALWQLNEALTEDDKRHSYNERKRNRS